MKILLFTTKNEKIHKDKISEALNAETFSLENFIFQQPFNNDCAQEGEIKEKIRQIDVVVYFASHENEKNICLDIALREAAQTNKKVICIWLDEAAALNQAFEALGDCLISQISQLPEAIKSEKKEWENADGSVKEDRPYKRYKCGSKQ